MRLPSNVGQAKGFPTSGNREWPRAGQPRDINCLTMSVRRSNLSKDGGNGM